MKQKITASGCADRLKAMADPDRLRIVTALRNGPKAVGELAESLPMELANVSHHLGVLRVSQIMLVEKQGWRRVYHLNPEESPDPALTTLEFGCCRLELNKVLEAENGRDEQVLVAFRALLPFCNSRAGRLRTLKRPDNQIGV